MANDSPVTGHSTPVLNAGGPPKTSCALFVRLRTHSNMSCCCPHNGQRWTACFSNRLLSSMDLLSHHLIPCVVVSAILFGGHEWLPPGREELSRHTDLLSWLSWKFVTPDATFKTNFNFDEIRETDHIDYRNYIAHWAGKVWFHSNEMPTGDNLRVFDLMSIEDEFRVYTHQHGGSFAEHGLTLEEVWATEQLRRAKPMVLILAEGYADQPLKRVGELLHTGRSESLVWLLAAMCVQNEVQSPSIGVLVTDGKLGHTIGLAGLNSIPYKHIRGDVVPAGWFSFHDPWPARSLLAPERNFGVRVLEDITRPPFWLISPSDFNKVIVGFLVSVDSLSGMLNLFARLDAAERAHRGSGRPLWIDDESKPEQPFSRLLSTGGGLLPTTVESLLGMARVRLHSGDLDDAVNLFGKAFTLDPGETVMCAESSFTEFGYDSLAAEWHNKIFGPY